MFALFGLLAMAVSGPPSGDRSGDPTVNSVQTDRSDIDRSDIVIPASDPASQSDSSTHDSDVNAAQSTQSAGRTTESAYAWMMIVYAIIGMLHILAVWWIYEDDYFNVIRGEGEGAQAAESDEAKQNMIENGGIGNRNSTDRNSNFDTHSIHSDSVNTVSTAESESYLAVSRSTRQGGRHSGRHSARQSRSSLSRPLIEDFHECAGESPKTPLGGRSTASGGTNSGRNGDDKWDAKPGRSLTTRAEDVGGINIDDNQFDNQDQIELQEMNTEGKSQGSKGEGNNINFDVNIKKTRNGDTHKKPSHGDSKKPSDGDAEKTSDGDSKKTSNGDSKKTSSRTMLITDAKVTISGRTISGQKITITNADVTINGRTTTVQVMEAQPHSDHTGSQAASKALAGISASGVAGESERVGERKQLEDTDQEEAKEQVDFTLKESLLNAKYLIWTVWWGLHYFTFTYYLGEGIILIWRKHVYCYCYCDRH
jgi:hypothetical protein